MLRLRWLKLWLVLVAVFGPVRSEVRELTILHTNDLHARFLPDGRRQGGFAYLAAAIRREQQGCNRCLLLDAGDLAQGSPASTIFRGAPAFEVRRLFPPDVSTLGNHEFDYGWSQIHEFIRAGRFEIVSSNVQDANGRLLTRRAYVIRQVNGIRVAVIGALTADLSHLTTPDLVGPWRALPVLETVRRYARDVQGQSDLVVVTGHINPQEEDQILKEAPEIGVVISGHTHAGLKTPKQAGSRVVVRVSAYGVELGRLDAAVDLEKKSVASSSWKRIPIDAGSIKPAADVAKAVARWEAKVSHIVDVPIGEAKRELTRAEVKLLMERALAEEMGTDFGFMNLGGVRDFFPKGRLLARHVWNVMPFDNKVVAGTFRGRDLPAAVKAGRTIDPDREYTLALSDFVAENQKAELGTEGLDFPRKGPVFRDLLIRWIKKKKVLE